MKREEIKKITGVEMSGQAWARLQSKHVKKVATVSIYQSGSGYAFNSQGEFEDKWVNLSADSIEWSDAEWTEIVKFAMKNGGKVIYDD